MLVGHIGLLWIGHYGLWVILSCLSLFIELSSQVPDTDPQ